MVDFEGKSKSIGHCGAENGRVHRQARAVLRVALEGGYQYNPIPMTVASATQIIQECKSCRAKIRHAIEGNPDTIYESVVGDQVVDKNLQLRIPN